MALSWDIFCTVVDNFGDAGICWRLAKQLTQEHAGKVRLWVDDLATFATLCANYDLNQKNQFIQGIEICKWQDPFPAITPHSVVIEAFACHLPESFLQAMAKQSTQPVWLNLEYLSAESWIEGCHQLSSRHAQLPLTRYFFFPGFTRATGGLIRESGLIERRKAFQCDKNAQADFLTQFGVNTDQLSRTRISLFCYENSALTALLAKWCEDSPKLLFVADGKPRQQVEAWLGEPFPCGTNLTKGKLTLLALPFLSQDDYDRLLWSCDINFVRGEDSFVRAQWAAAPMIWHIYPQSDEVHLDKLDAFLARYEASLSPAAAQAHRAFQHAWNTGSAEAITLTWLNLLPHVAALRTHADAWCSQLGAQGDLASQLQQFAEKIHLRDG